MAKWTCNIGIEEKLIVMTVVACRGCMNEPPNAMYITSSHIDADERFMVSLKTHDGQWLASCHAHEIIKRSWENK